MALSSIVQYLSRLSYLGIGVYSGTLGYFIPVPEEAAFIVLGYLAGQGKFNFFGAFFCAAFGIWLADQFFYAIAYRESRYLLKFKNRIREDVWDHYEKSMAKNILKAMVLSRFLVGFRFIGAVIAGTLKVPYRRFLIYDVTIIALYVGSLMYLGFSLRRRALKLIAFVEQFHNVILFVVVVILLAVIWRLMKNKKQN